VAAAGRIEWAFAHQAVHAGFGAQQAKGIFAFDLERCAADASNVAIRLFQDFRLESLAFAVFEVLPEKHACPVAGFSAACASLDVDETIVGIGRIVEHAPEFERGDLRFYGAQIGGNGAKGGIIIFITRHFKQFAGVGERLGDLPQRQHDIFKLFFFLAQFLGALGIVPDFGVFKLETQFFEFCCLGIEVKDTPVGRFRAG